LVAAITAMTGSRPAAEDAVQEALARAWERSERGQPIESLEAWVTTVAVNLARSGLRRVLVERRARQRLSVRPDPFAAGSAGVGDRVDVMRALARLPRRQREATVLRYYLGMDVKEIARVLRIREGTAKTTLHRARLALATRLGERDLEEANDRGHR
jgi:RNA polymerase sigma-70 factor (ECF subfamily)